MKNKNTEQLHQNINSIENFQLRGIDTIMEMFEKEGYSKNLDSLLHGWENIMGKNMRYDALNYIISIGYNHEDDAGLWIANIASDTIRFTDEQKKIFIRHLERYKSSDNDELNEKVDEIIQCVNQDNYEELIRIFTNAPTLQKLISGNANLWRDWKKYYYGLPLDTMMTENVGNCKTYALLLKGIIENASRKWNLNIKQVAFHENIDGHVVLRIHLNTGMIPYDPLSPLYKKI